MIKKRRFLNFRVIGFLLFYVLVFLYTITFPSTVTWFTFYAFSCFLVVSYFSTRFFLVVEDIQWTQKKNQRIDLTLTIRTKGRIPFFLPSIQLRILKDDIGSSLHTSALFTRILTCTFTDVPLPRGYHETLQLEAEGLGLFGVFKHRSAQHIPVNMKIYPYLLPKTERANYIQKVSPILTHKDFAPIHEFHVREIRTYQDRDSMSNIDWKSSLKRGQWMVKEYDHEDSSPIGIYFFGQESPYFEELLSIAYSLYLDLTMNEQARMYLFGSIEDEVKLEQTKEQFLYIQATDKNDKINNLWHETAGYTTKKIVIAPSDYSIPRPKEQMKETIYLTEKDLATAYNKATETTPIT